MGPKRKAISQPASSSKNNFTRNQSQRTIDATFREISNSNADINDQVNDCVRYIVYKAGHHLPFRRNDLLKHLKDLNARALDSVLERASNILKNVYGLKLILCENKSKFYILSNILLDVENSENNESTNLPGDTNKIILMLVLLHIYMFTNIVTEGSLYSFLKSFNIDPERKHELFGNVKEYITVTLVKQHYLNTEKDSISQELSFFWGLRAEKEISKHDLLKFACKILKINSPKSLLAQYKDAEKQPLENNRTQLQDENIDDES